MNTIQREQQARIYMGIISVLGWLIVITSLFYLELPGPFLLFIVLVIFLGYTEYYPLPVWKGSSSLSFPLIFSLDLVVGFPLFIVSYAIVIFIVNYIQKRPSRILFFNPAQLVISYAAAKGAVYFLADYIPVTMLGQSLYLYLELAILVILFYSINNFIVDFVLWVRPQPYRFSDWKQKLASEFLSAFISFLYISLMIFLGSQENRGNLDIFSAFFFFSPLVGLSLLFSSISRLKTEKNRLNAMFTFTKELNQTIHTKSWSSGLSGHVQELFGAQATMLLIKEDIWTFDFKEGLIKDSKEPIKNLSDLEEVVIIDNRKKMSGPLDDYFHPGIMSIVYAPLLLDQECVGILAVGRTRTYSFEPQDVRSIATMAYQLAGALKTKSLINEQKEKRVLEERNRIAREIHDGIAQTVAGAVMNLETAKKRYTANPKDTILLIDRSLEDLRSGLKQVRESIYALRPKPTERVSLEQAIRKRIEILVNQQPFKVSLEVRGTAFALPLTLEKVMFDTFQESIQNTIKHADATKAEILLSYQSEHVLLKIKDNGIGFSLYDALVKAKNKPHFGLISMNEEAVRMDVSLQIDSKPGGGTEIALTVPKHKTKGDEESD